MFLLTTQHLQTTKQTKDKNQKTKTTAVDKFI